MPPATDPLAPAPATPAAPAPAAPSAPAGTPMTTEDADRLIGALEKGWSQVIKAVQQPAPAPKPAPTPARAEDDDALTAIAANGWKPVQDKVAETVNKVIQDTLVPYLGAQAGDAATANEAAVQAAVDAEFGEGTYKDLFKGRVDELFEGQVANRAIRGQFDRAVQLVKGERFGDLADRRSKLTAERAAKAEEEKKMARAPYLPGRGGYVNPDTELLLSEEERDQLKKTKDATGWAPSEEDAAKMRNMVMRSRDGISLEQFNKEFPLPKS